jgi:hypothetical protein
MSLKKRAYLYSANRRELKNSPVPLFTPLAADANGIIANVTTGNFSNASALLVHYNSTIKQITSSTNASQQGTTFAASAPVLPMHLENNERRDGDRSSSNSLFTSVRSDVTGLHNRSEKDDA